MIKITGKPESERYTFEELYELIRLLRSPEGCPWDREQTHESLVKPMLEEAYEAVDAIEQKRADKMTEELGDVLLQVIFHSIIGQEEGEYDFLDITDRCARKMLFRHSHVFGDAVAEDAGAALENWEDTKRKEKGFCSLQEDLQDIPKNFPALMRAAKVAKKIRKAGNDPAETVLLPDCRTVDYASEDEVGALLYAICAEAERCGTDTELALKRATDKVIAERNG